MQSAVTRHSPLRPGRGVEQSERGSAAIEQLSPALASRLGEPSTPPERLVKVIRQICTDIKVWEFHTPAPITEKIGTEGSKPGSKPPRGSAHHAADGFLANFQSARNNLDRLTAIANASAYLERVRTGMDRSRVRGTLQWKVAIARDPRISYTVARQYGVSDSYVRTLRKRYRDGRLRLDRQPTDL